MPLYLHLSVNVSAVGVICRRFFVHAYCLRIETQSPLIGIVNTSPPIVSITYATPHILRMYITRPSSAIH